MNKKSIVVILVILITSFVIISLYTTFAYNEETTKIDNSNADYNLIYSLKEKSNRELKIVPNEVKVLYFSVSSLIFLYLR